MFAVLCCVFFIREILADPYPTPAQKAVLTCLENYETQGLKLTKYGDSSYDDERYSYNRRIEGLPMVISHPNSVVQVQWIVGCHYQVIHSGNFSERVNLTIRSGGHSYEGYSTNQHGVVVDMNLFQNVTFQASTVSVQPGIRLGDLYNTLNSHNNWTAVGGTCPMVGFGGFVLGGGFGHISRRYGLGADQILGVDVVLYNGSLIHANASQNSDLWWASRGGGGGNFGVVTSVDLKPVIGLGVVCSYYVSFSISPTDWVYVAQLFALLQPWAPVQSQLWGSIVYQLQPRSNQLGLFGFYLSPDQAGLQAALKALLNTPAMLALNKNHTVNIKTKIGGYNTFMQQELPRDDRQWFKATNNYIAEGSLLNITALELLYKTAMHNVSYKPQLVQFHAYGSACQVNALKPTDSAFPHRNMAWHLQTYTTTNQDAGYVNYMEDYNFLTHDLFPDASYVDYVDSWLGDEGPSGDFQFSYYNTNADRLRTIKKIYDPIRAFDFPQAVR